MKLRKTEQLSINAQASEPVLYRRAKKLNTEAFFLEWKQEWGLTCENGYCLKGFRHLSLPGLCYTLWDYAGGACFHWKQIVMFRWSTVWPTGNILQHGLMIYYTLHMTENLSMELQKNMDTNWRVLGIQATILGSAGKLWSSGFTNICFAKL